MPELTLTEYQNDMNSIPINHFKVCAEAACNFVYVPDHTGKCPRCGSDGIWISKITERDTYGSCGLQES